VSERERLEEALRLAATGRPGQAYDLALARQHLIEGDQVLEADWADCLADCCLKMARYELGIGHTRRAAAIWQALGNAPRLAKSLSLMAEFLADIGSPDAAATASLAIEVAERAEDAGALARANMAFGLVLFMAREPDKALPFSERAVTLSRQAGVSLPVAVINWAEAVLLAGLQAAGRGNTAALAPAVARAVALTREALAEARASGDGWLARLALNNIADYSMHIGDTATAAAALAEVADTPGVPTTRCRANHLTARAKLLAGQGKLQAAKLTFEDCLDVLRDSDYLEIELMCHQELAKLLERMGRFEDALAAHRRFHDCFVRMASAGAQRLARLAAVTSEMQALRAAAARAQSLAASLVRSNAELAREAERLLRANLEDTLTGLPNRRRMEMALDELSVSGAPFACAMLDLDHFKQINDRFSHDIGDAVLREIGVIFRNAARQDDLVVRFGGEEFAAVIRTEDAALARLVCERLRADVEAADWRLIQPGLKVTVSVGLALSGETAAPAAALKLADTRLYEAKKRGRNRLVGP
jgi:diguanylate cyclase (GGDEF)-like protein